MVLAVRMWLVLSLLLWSNAALAQAGSPQAKPAAGANDNVARGLFQAGKAAYEAGSYEEALELFERAHARSGRPGLLFNIGQVADRLRQDDKALTSFRAYLEQVPDAPNRPEVESRIAALERAEAERAAAASATPASVATPEQAARQSVDSAPGPVPTSAKERESSAKPVTQTWWFWTSIGAAVAGGTAVALAVALGGDEAGTEAPYQGTAGSFRGP